MLRITNESHEEAKRLLSAHRKQLDALAEALIEREAIDEKDVLAVTGLPPAPALKTEKLPVTPAAGKDIESSS